MKRMISIGLVVLGFGCLTVLGQETPDQVPTVRVWELSSPLAKSREALLEVLKSEGLELEEGAPEGTIQTAFSRFDKKRFASENVAEPPPQLAEDYLLLQQEKATQGRFRLRARFEPAAEGTLITVEVEILVPAFHSMVVGTSEAPRVSNGVIEEHFHQLLQAALAGGDPEPKKNPRP